MAVYRDLNIVSCAFTWFGIQRHMTVQHACSTENILDAEAGVIVCYSIGIKSFAVVAHFEYQHFIIDIDIYQQLCGTR